MARVLCASLLSLAASVSAPAAQAAFISFDERPRNPPIEVEGDWRADPVWKEYEPMGVRFDDAYLQGVGADPVYDKSRFLLGGNGFGVTFLDAAGLPTHVSLSFSTPWSGFVASVGAIDRNGQFLGSFDTGGDHWAGPDLGWVHTPYHPHSYASFYSEAGISRLVFSAEGGTRLTGMIDNLYFGAVPAVPEPGALALWASGLLVLGAAARRLRRNGSR